jgi:aryl-alcohol dehydrogenase-like predicted oxidoreductase
MKTRKLRNLEVSAIGYGCMGLSHGYGSVHEGAKGIVWAAALPDDGPSGGFFCDGKAVPW